jgi:hypothetical protein
MWELTLQKERLILMVMDAFLPNNKGGKRWKVYQPKKKFMQH